MAFSPRPVLLLGHSFIRRLSEDLQSQFDERANVNFKLSRDAIVHLHGVGGLTVRRLVRSKLGVVSSLSPHVVILEIGTNDLSTLAPEVVGSEIEELVRLLLETYSIRAVGVCEVILRVRAPLFNAAARTLNQYLNVVLDPIPNAFCWEHHGFSEPSQNPYSDGVHVNSFGQYVLYRSYRGAILHALRMLS